MTKKDLIEFLEDYPDDTLIKIYDECIDDAQIDDYVDTRSDRKAVLIFGGYRGGYW